MNKNKFDVAASIQRGLEQAVAHSKGDNSAVTKITEVTVIAVKPVTKYKANDIKKIRKTLNLTQKRLADILGVSLRTVECWETGKNVPNGSSSRLLEILQCNSSAVFEMVGVLEN